MIKRNSLSDYIADGKNQSKAAYDSLKKSFETAEKATQKLDVRVPLRA